MSVNTNNNTNAIPENIQELNDKWKATVSPKVFCSHEGELYKGETVESKREKEEYKFGEILKKIKTFQSEGKSICLFIGRTLREKLPSDNSEAKENEVWISADIGLKSLDPCSRFIDYSSNDIYLRLHLWLDFNQQEGLSLVQGLFDKIVIDQSTSKFFDNDFVTRFCSLLRTNESEMIFEDPVRISGLNKVNFTASQVGFKASSYRFFVYDLIACDLNLAKREATGFFERHLKNTCNSVERKQNVKYPYRTNYTADVNTDYFVVRHRVT